MVPSHKRNGNRPELAHVATYLCAKGLMQPFLGDGTGRHRWGGQACRRAPATTRISLTVLMPIGVIGVSGTKCVLDIAVVFAARIRIANQQGDGGTGGAALIHARQDFNTVGFTSLCDMARCAGPTT